MKCRDYVILVVVLLICVSLLLLNNWTDNVVVFDNVSTVVNKQIAYQASTLLITILFLFLLWTSKKQEFCTYFRKGTISAKVMPAPWVGINPKDEKNWVHVGRSVTISITLVTVIVIYFQVFKGNELDVAKLVGMLPVAILFSIVNSFVEESVTRLGVVVALKDIVADKHIMLISGVLFGVLHYWGTPGGIVGAIVAGFLGWFLAKSILETKGFFWAWTIHFLQDVVVFSAMLMIA